MAKKVDGSYQRVLVGTVLIVIGALFLMSTLNVMDIGSVFAHWWPMIIIAVGFLKLTGPDKTGGAIVFIVGIVLLSATLDIIHWSSILAFWPLILILLGLSIVLKRDRTWWGRTCTRESTEDFIKSSAIFGGVDRTVTSENLQGGDVMALFGGVDLDLRQAKVSGEECRLSLTALFGAAEVIVPPHWQVSVSGTPIFGAIENKTTWTKGEEQGVKVHFRCTVAFGAIEIKN